MFTDRQSKTSDFSVFWIITTIALMGIPFILLAGSENDLI